MSNRRLWWARLSSNSPRYQDWRGILGTDEVPLTSPGSGFTKLGDEQKQEVYLLDVAQLSEEQFDRLVEFVVKKFQADPGEVRSEIKRVGFPIRAADCYVAFDMRAFL